MDAETFRTQALSMLLALVGGVYALLFAQLGSGTGEVAGVAAIALVAAGLTLFADEVVGVLERLSGSTQPEVTD